MIYGIILIIALICIVSVITFANNKNDNTDNNILKNDSIIDVLNNKYSKKKYLKLKNGEILTDNTSFSEYSFIIDNSIYIFNPQKLDKGELEYKKVYDLDSNIKVMNIAPNYGADIKFYDYNDTLYTLHDDNLDNLVNNNYDMYLNANYNLSDYLKWEYSTNFLGKKISYDYMSEYVFAKDDILYYKSYGNDKYPDIEKVDGNYIGENIIKIFNERIVKTNKVFYELMSYFDTNLNKKIVTTVKINMLSKYYSEILTLTYKYIVLKDYTLIPINDVMENRVRKYSYDYFLSGFNSMKEIKYEE